MTFLVYPFIERLTMIICGLDPPGSRLPLHLAAITHGPTIQHIQDRVNLISAQHNLGTPSKTVSSLLMLAFEVCSDLNPSDLSS